MTPEALEPGPWMLPGPAVSSKLVPSVVRAVPSSAGACHEETLVTDLRARRGEVSAWPASMKMVLALHRRGKLLLQIQQVQENLDIQDFREHQKGTEFQKSLTPVLAWTAE